MINVEVCYALPKEQHLITLDVPEGTTVISAIIRSGILDKVPDIVLKDYVGIFSVRVSLHHLLTDGDRIEIYRPLKLTPNQARLMRAKRVKK